MQSIQSAREMQAQALSMRAAGKRIGLVPTMGYLHEGHLSLVRLARQQCDTVVVSIYVNPTQFAPGEDLDSYPRDLERDRALCEREGVDLVFLPSDDVMYAPDHSVYVEEVVLSGVLCGRSRPSHFRGVTTVVAKLFNLVQPHVAVFGRKDAQQVRVIEQMVRDLNFPVQVVVAPIVREADGLALSSRNKYLNLAERDAARLIHAGLLAAETQYAAGERSGEQLCCAVLDSLAASPLIRPDYVEIVDYETLRPVSVLQGRALLAAAAVLGQTRLIDNVLLDPCLLPSAALR